MSLPAYHLLRSMGTQILTSLLECTEEQHSPHSSADIGMALRILDTQDLSRILDESTLPLSLLPSSFSSHPTSDDHQEEEEGTFTSPFAGQSAEEVREWFSAHMAQNPERRGKWTRLSFVVLDEQTLQDESTCLFVYTTGAGDDDDEDQSIETQSLRCDFYLALGNAMDCEMGAGGIEDGLMGSFMRQGIVMTREGYEIAAKGGIYMEDGEVKKDPFWADFAKG